MSDPEGWGARERRVLDRLAAGLTPQSGRSQATWTEISRRIERAKTWESMRPSRAERWSTIRQTMWGMLVSLAVLGATVFTLTPLFDREAASARELSYARDRFEQRDYSGTYRLLVAHSRRHRSLDAARQRTELVVRTLCAMGETERAHRELMRFLERDPDSPYRHWLPDPCN